MDIRTAHANPHDTDHHLAGSCLWFWNLPELKTTRTNYDCFFHTKTSLIMLFVTKSLGKWLLIYYKSAIVDKSIRKK
jgi:hypothetical protein